MEGSAGKGTAEGQAVELTDGTIMMNCRGDRREVYVSKDAGASFTRADGAERMVGGGCQGSILRYSTKDNGGKNILLFSNPCHPLWRVNLAVRVSYDEGTTWPVTRVIDPGSAQYSCLVVLPDGDIGVMYENAGKSKLTFVRFSLEWLTGTKTGKPR